jgi:hypothetical protein
MKFSSVAFMGQTGASASIVQDGLVFDFRAQDYVSGSLTWNSFVGNYTASVTGTVAGGLEYFDGSKVGFDGNKWLTFNEAMSSSISSSQWNVYVLTEFTNTQLQTNTFKPAFFSKGVADFPDWNWWFRGGNSGASPSQTGDIYTNGWVNSSVYNEGGGFADSYSASFAGQPKQLFGYQIIGSPTGSSGYGLVTPNWTSTIPGNFIGISPAVYGPNSFTGSILEPLLFGKEIDQGFGYPASTNMTGSVVRIFGYNKNLSDAERRQNYIALFNTYPS